jgi:hypothetical protein
VAVNSRSPTVGPSGAGSGRSAQGARPQKQASRDAQRTRPTGLARLTQRRKEHSGAAEPERHFEPAPSVATISRLTQARVALVNTRVIVLEAMADNGIRGQTKSTPPCPPA